MSTLYTGDHFVGRLLEGLTDFRGARLEPGFELLRHERWPELREFFEKRDFENQPLDFSGADFPQLKARGWKIPFSVWKGAKLDGVDLSESVLDHADFTDVVWLRGNLGRASLRETQFVGARVEQSNLEEAKLSGATLWKAKLSGSTFFKADLTEAILAECDLVDADLSKCDLTKVNLWSANVEAATFKGTILRDTNLKGVRNLEKSRALPFARFLKTRMGRLEHEIILAQMREKLFHLVD